MHTYKYTYLKKERWYEQQKMDISHLIPLASLLYADITTLFQGIICVFSSIVLRKPMRVVYFFKPLYAENGFLCPWQLNNILSGCRILGSALLGDLYIISMFSAFQGCRWDFHSLFGPFGFVCNLVLLPGSMYNFLFTLEIQVFPGLNEHF